jgi:hypothetical protein
MGMGRLGARHRHHLQGMGSYLRGCGHLSTAVPSASSPEPPNSIGRSRIQAQDRRQVDAPGSHAESSGPGHGHSSLETTGKRPMSRIGKLLPATGQDNLKGTYQEGLLAHWEERWSLLGPTGQADWFQRHGVQAPARLPLVHPAIHGIRRRLTGGQQSPFGITLRRIRAAL